MIKSNKRLKPKKFVGKLIRICLTCGSEKISSNKYTILCTVCGRINFYEGVDSFAPLDEKNWRTGGEK